MKKITGFVILASIVVLVAYDFFAYSKGGTDATISWLIWTWSLETPTVSFSAGYLCGHLFAQMKGKKK